MSNNIFFERGQMADKPNNYLWNGDCLELMKDIPDKSMDAIICDLPYGTTACKWDSVIPFEPLWEQYKRIIKDNGAIVLFGSQPFTSALISSNTEMFIYEWIWEKPKSTGHALSKIQPMKAHENIIVFGICKIKYTPQLTKGEAYKGRNRTDYKESKEFSTGQGNRNNNTGFRYPKSVQKFKNTQYVDKQVHPTQKPLPLLKYLVKTYTDENDWVLDNTCGSNTTGIACYDLNRNYIGIEKDVDIYEVAKKRVEKNILLRANQQQTLFKEKP